MEIRARYVIIGLFVLAAIFAGFGFVYWLNNTAGIGPRSTYRVAFAGSVSGLSVGSPVLFNGLVVGEVTGLALVPDKPEEVMATIAVDASTPVRTDTHVGLDFRGLTGTATVALAGGTAAATFAAGETPTLTADANAMKDMTTAARDVLANIDKLISDNKAPITDAIANIDTFSKALGANSDKVDGIMKGLAKLAGAGGEENLVNYDLTAPTTFPPIPALPTVQLAVSTPTAVISLDSRNITVQTADGEAPGFPAAQLGRQRAATGAHAPHRRLRERRLHEGRRRRRQRDGGLQAAGRHPPLPRLHQARRPRRRRRIGETGQRQRRRGQREDLLRVGSRRQHRRRDHLDRGGQQRLREGRDRSDRVGARCAGRRRRPAAGGGPRRGDRFQRRAPTPDQPAPATTQ